MHGVWEIRSSVVKPLQDRKVQWEEVGTDVEYATVLHPFKISLWLFGKWISGGKVEEGEQEGHVSSQVRSGRGSGYKGRGRM